ncbi:hypothetical protein [Algiphilus sp.]|jgi:hypothetical protein|uniref:hypothetical protein n=1 Tax=Algiphilus sp. TaxID=1872431 RepID=UPI0032EE0D24
MSSDPSDGFTGKTIRRIVERRSGKDRRQNTEDRRDNIRFELDKEPRRSGVDRRKSSSNWTQDPDVKRNKKD